LISISYIFQKTQEDFGAIDFHSYWYAGHFVRAATNPYAAYLLDETPKEHLSYIDSTDEHIDPARAGLAKTPANTSPLVLLLSCLSFFSWPLAKNIWMIFNYLFIFSISSLVIKITNFGDKQTWTQKIAITALFISLFGTRNVAATGQTSLFVFYCMLASLHLANRDSHFLSGVSLGLALSKYSLALPVLLLMIYKKEFRVIGLALLIQVLGILSLAALTHSHPIAIVYENYQIMKVHLGQSGIHLSHLFANHPLPTGISMFVISLLMTLSIFLSVKSRNKRLLARPTAQKHNEHLLLVILIIWTLLIAYHKAYDSLLIILFLSAGFYWANPRISRGLTQPQKHFLRVVLAGSTIIFMLPASGVIYLGAVIPSTLISNWVEFHNYLLSMSLVFLLGYVFWLLYTLMKPIKSSVVSVN
jgi:hypothetical protein